MRRRIWRQNDDNGIPHPIAYASWATNDVENKYLPEVAAIIIICIEAYLLDHKITIFTDYQVLVMGYLSYSKD